MKVDLAKLPVGEMVIGFLLLALGVTFLLAFDFTSDAVHEDEQLVDLTTPTPAVTPAPGEPIPVDMGDNFFDPDTITVPAGETVTFELTNIGNAPHNMQIADEEGNFVPGICDPNGETPCSQPNQVPGGSEAILIWDVYDLPPGTEIPFHCDFHVIDMTGVIVIE